MALPSPDHVARLTLAPNDQIRHTDLEEESPSPLAVPGPAAKAAAVTPIERSDEPAARHERLAGLLSGEWRQ